MNIEPNKAIFVTINLHQDACDKTARHLKTILF